jgi:Ca2+-binding RTX toxin-like protein
MTDSLAVYDLFFHISPSFRSLPATDVLQRLAPIFAASAVEDKGVIFTTPSAALENLVNAFGKLYVAGYTPISSSQYDNREVLYTKLDAIRTAMQGKSATVTSLVDQAASQVISKAQLDDAEGLAYRYALTELNPFVLIGADYSTVNSGHELDLYDPETDTGTLTDLYLADRAAMLSWIIKRNKEDSTATILDSNAPDAIFRDIAGVNLFGTPLVTTEIRLGSGGDADRRHFTFGSTTGDAISGGNKNDHLYGMGGNDTISGGLGNDYIEGGAGQDILHGDEGNDILMGGRDVDILDGGSGNDQLKGGEGVDVYQFNGSFGLDVITDSDGQGFISIDNTPANSGTRQLQNIYKNDTTGTTFTQANGGSTLIISKEDDTNRIIINNWSETSNLGISLTGDAVAPDAVAGFTGDFKKLIDDHGTTDTSDDTYVMDDNGNYTRDPNALNGEPGAPDLISGTDAVAGIGGNDVIYGGLGEDTLYGGAEKRVVANDLEWRMAA